MSRHVLFLVHGMGNFKDDWSKNIQKLIKDQYKGYTGVDNAPFDDLFEFKEINYNKFFEARRDAWKNKASEISELLEANGFSNSAITKIMQFASAPTGDEFFRTHVLDVIMYRFLPQVAEQIRRSIQYQILETLKKFPENESPDWSVIAHSLGTSVMHDTLHAVFTHDVDDDLLSRSARLSVLCMVANVSRLLWNDVDFFGTVVRPHPFPTKGICSRYINIRHTLDPFPRPKPFHPPASFWLDQQAKDDGAYKNVRIPAEEVTNWNVHGFAHYIKNPRAHVPLFRSLLFDRVIQNQEFSKKLKEYRKTRLKADDRTKALNELKKLGKGKVEDWEDISEILTNFRKLVLEKEPSADEGES